MPPTIWKSFPGERAFAFWINGIKPGDFNDGNPRSGDIGLWVESFPEGGVQIGFDDLKIWAVKSEIRL